MGHRHQQHGNGALFAAKFVAAEVSTNDSFHPSVAGQTSLASIAWEQLSPTF